MVEGIVRNVAPKLDKNEQERLARFAKRNPQAARLFAVAWEGSLVAGTPDALVDRVLLGRRPDNKGQLRRAGMLLAVFGLVGIKEPLEDDLEQIASLPGAPTAEELRALFEDLARRGVAQPRGRLLTLQPPPISLPGSIMAVEELEFENLGRTQPQLFPRTLAFARLTNSPS